MLYCCTAISTAIQQFNNATIQYCNAMFYYPYVGFSFQVNFLDLPDKGSNTDMHFQSVKGLEVQMDTEPIKEGGVNTHEHTVPVRAKPSTLTLERGMFQPEKSRLLIWCVEAFANFKFQPVNLQVTLFNEQREPLFTWQLEHVLPKSWKVKDLNAQQGEVLIETLELSYNRMRHYPKIGP